MKLLLQRRISASPYGRKRRADRRARKRSSEYLHEAVYRARPDVNAVVHHCPYLTAYALRCRDFIVPEDCLAARFIFQQFVCLPYGKTGRMRSKGIEAALHSRSACSADGVVCSTSGKLHQSAGSGGRAGEDAVGEAG